MFAEKIPDCRFIQAIKVALKQHDGQKSLDGRPYISHCLEVAQLVCQFGGCNEAEIVAVLHDVLEDTQGYSQAKMEEDFGKEITQSVCLLTEPKGPWFVQKINYLRNITKADDLTLLVCCCDKIHNLETILSEYSKQREQVWERIGISKRQKMGFYHLVCQAAIKRVRQMPDVSKGVREALDCLQRDYFYACNVVGYDSFRDCQRSV